MPEAKQSPETVVQQNLNSYNNRDIEIFMESFSEDIQLYSLGEKEPVLEGLDAFRSFYKELFQQSPELYSTVLKRIVYNNTVIDHERIKGRMGSDIALELVMIYEVKRSKIFRMTILKD